MADAWYIEKNGKFYGPFTVEKVLSYSATGKINPRTLIATDINGSGALPFVQIEAELRSPSPAPSGEPPAKSADRASPPATGENKPSVSITLPGALPIQPPKAEENQASTWEPKTAKDHGGFGEETGRNPREWMIVVGDNHYGPYSLGYLERLVPAGKLKRHDQLLRQGQNVRIRVEDLLPEPEFSQKTPSQRPPSPKEKPPAPKATKSNNPSPRSSAKRPVGQLILSAVVILSVAMVLLLMKPFSNTEPPPASAPNPQAQNPPNKLLAKIRRAVGQGSELRTMMRQSEAPPYNQLVQSALTKGLNFRYISSKALASRALAANSANTNPEQDLLTMHQKDLLLSEDEGDKAYGAWFPDRIRYEIHFVEDGGYQFTYLVGMDSIIFAVAISHPTFNKVMLEDSKPADFGPGPTRGKDFGFTSWTTEIVPGIEAKALWRDNGDGRHSLASLCVLNSDPAGVKEN